jgi:small subunit ribosomal protein S20
MGLIEYLLFYVSIELLDRTREVKDMANIKSAIKRASLSEERRAHNASLKSDMRTAVKTVEALLNNNDLENAKAAFAIAAKKLDKAATKGLIHKNAAARKKSRLAKQLNGTNA